MFFHTELRGVNAKYESLLKEYHKALKTLEKSRKARDVEMLFSENEALQRKLVTQEEEFRLQNETLLQELKMVCFLTRHSKSIYIIIYLIKTP